MNANGAVSVLTDVWGEIKSWQNAWHAWQDYADVLRNTFEMQKPSVRSKVATHQLATVGRCFMQLLVGQQHRFKLGPDRQAQAFCECVWRTFFGGQTEILVPLWIPAKEAPKEEIFCERLNALEHLQAFFDSICIRTSSADTRAKVLVAGMEWLDGACGSTQDWIACVNQDLGLRRLGDKVEACCLVEYVGGDKWQAALRKTMENFLPKDGAKNFSDDFERERALCGWFSQLIHQMRRPVSNRCWLMLSGYDYYPAPERKFSSICWSPRPDEQ